jgi:hypothetical protein
MPEEPSGAEADALVARARLRGKRIALGIVLVVSVAFVGASTLEIVEGVFAMNIRPLPSGAVGTAARTCAEGIRQIERDIERGGPGNPSPVRMQRTDGGDDASTVEQACAQSPEGLDAWAALRRLVRAREAARQGSEANDSLAPLEREVVAHLPADLR